MQRGKIVWSTAYSIFVPCGSKIGDATSSKMCYVMSHKACNYQRAIKRRLVAGIILLGASERQETKIHKAWSLCQPQKVLRQSCWCLKAQELHTASFQATYTYTTCSQKSWHFFAGYALVLPHLVSCIWLQLLSLLWSPSIAVCDIIRMKQSDWSATNVALGTKIE